MARGPVGRADVVKRARPSDKASLPRMRSPSLNVTVPVGVPPVPLTAAVNVTAVPTSLVELDAVSSISVALFRGASGGD
jgi:hypothetical protein